MKISESTVASDVLIQIKDRTDTKKAECSTRSKASKLWINYRKILRAARTIIRADRKESWKMHLCAVSGGLLVFAAAGPYNYLKSAYFYLQEMCQFEARYLDVS